MPIYEYVCTACGHEFSEIQKFSDKPITKCPECGKSKVEKKISLSGFQLKGQGWYKDGYSKSSEKSGASDKKPSDSGKKETKSEAKACGSGKSNAA